MTRNLVLARLVVPKMNNKGDFSSKLIQLSESVSRYLFEETTEIEGYLDINMMFTFRGPDNLYHTISVDNNKATFPFVSRFLSYEKVLSYGFVLKETEQMENFSVKQTSQNISGFLQTIGSGD